MLGHKVFAVTLVTVALSTSIVGAVKSAKKSGSVVQADERHEVADSGAANPIRKVVNMLQSMAKKVEAEAKKEEDLYEKFQCYCTKGAADLELAISSSSAKIPAVQAEINETEATVAQLKVDLDDHAKAREAAKTAIDEATAIREKEHAAYVPEAAQYKEYVAALASAIPAIEKGMVGAGLLQAQSATVATIRRATDADTSVTDDDKQSVLSFLSGSADARYIPGSGEIVGILKTMQKDFEKSLEDVETTEATALKVYEELVAAKEKEIKTLSHQIETKTARVGDLEVKVVTLKGEMSDEEASLVEDQKFIKDLKSDCKSKTGEYEERVKTRAEELVAIHETIKILNDDDALDLFKKTLPSASSFVQLGRDDVTQKRKDQALALLHAIKPGAEQKGSASDVRFIELALGGGKVDFTKVFKMIDDMVALLKEEQIDDDAKVEYCNKQIDTAEDSAKELAKSVQDYEMKLEEMSGDLETTKGELKELEKAIAELDKSVEEATLQRKQENEDFMELMSSNKAAKELLEFAKNRLNKFYSPNLYKEPPKQEESFVQESAHMLPWGKSAFFQISSVTGRDDPGPPPALGSYQKKAGESNMVISMLDRLIRDLDKETAEAGKQEEMNQKSYEELMNDSASKRAKDVKGVTLRQSSKADLESSIVQYKGELDKTKKEQLANAKYSMNLHKECDWLLQNYDLRKEARAEEMDNLKKAKAVLAGADFTFLQAHPDSTAPFLSRRGN